MRHNIKQMKEHPTHKGYFLTEDGRVFSNKRGPLKEMKLRLDRTGYCSIMLHKKCYKVHRLVAETYIPNPDNLPCVNHKDEDKTNNHVDNLEWCDHAYNCEYSFSKSYKIKTPTNEIVEVFNLSKFCREHNLNKGALYGRSFKSKGYSIVQKS